MPWPQQPSEFCSDEGLWICLIEQGIRRSKLFSVERFADQLVEELELLPMGRSGGNSKQRIGIRGVILGTFHFRFARRSQCGACIGDESGLIYAVQEERLNGEKNYWGFPQLAIQACLDRGCDGSRSAGRRQRRQTGFMQLS